MKEVSASGLHALAATSSNALSGSAPDLEELPVPPRGYSRDSFVVVPLDGNFRGAAVSVLSPTLCT